MDSLKIHKPKLIICVVGGSADFEVDKVIKESFKKGIMKAANATDTWIVTSGINAGVCKIGRNF